MLPFYVIAVRFLLIVMFAAASLGKLRSEAARKETSAAARDAFHLQTTTAARLTNLLVAAETGTVLMLLVPATWPAGLLVGAALLASMGLAVARIVATGTASTCHCFGPGRSTLGWPQVARNGLLAGLAATAFAVSTLTAPARPDSPLLIAAGAVGAAAASLIVRWDDLAYLMSNHSRLEGAPR